jgi:hypothetical protein
VKEQGAVDSVVAAAKNTDTDDDVVVDQRLGYKLIVQMYQSHNTVDLLNRQMTLLFFHTHTVMYFFVFFYNEGSWLRKTTQGDGVVACSLCCFSLSIIAMLFFFALVALCCFPCGLAATQRCAQCHTVARTKMAGMRFVAGQRRTRIRRRLSL